MSRLRRFAPTPSRADGITLLEVVLALAILAVLGAVFSTSILSNLRHTTVSGQRTQAAQALNYFGRRVAGGDPVVLPTAVGSAITWDYDELADAFDDLSGSDGFADADRYRVTVTAANEVSLFSGADLASVVQYDIQVCFQNQGAESCVSGTTLGAPASAPAGETPPLPGIN